MTVIIKSLSKYPKFQQAWHTCNYQSATDFMKHLGYKSAYYHYINKHWEMDDQEYLLFLLKWS